MTVTALLAGPTPVRALTGRIWIKDERAANAEYGGNKVRKLDRILADAEAAGATDLWTVGGIGSHHVLATAIHGGARGLRTHAALFAQPDTPHVRANGEAIHALCASTAVLPGGWRTAAAAVSHWTHLRRTAGRLYRIPVGGSSAEGVRGWIDGGIELADQVRAGLLPRPSRIYVALGTGGTAAGLLVGLARAGLDAEVVGVQVVDRWVANGARVRVLAELAMGRPRVRLGRFRVDTRWFCGGYGRSDDRIAAAMARCDVPLESCYTGKALAAALADDADEPADVVFVQTAPGEAPAGSALPPELEALLGCP